MSKKTTCSLKIGYLIAIVYILTIRKQKSKQITKKLKEVGIKSFTLIKRVLNSLSKVVKRRFQKSNKSFRFLFENIKYLFNSIKPIYG